MTPATMTAVALDAAGSATRPVYTLQTAPGESATAPFVNQHADGSAYNLTGCTVTMTVYMGKQLVKRVVATVDTAASGTCHVDLATISSGLRPDTYAWDLWLVDANLGKSFQVIGPSTWAIGYDERSP